MWLETTQHNLFFFPGKIMLDITKHACRCIPPLLNQTQEQSLLDALYVSFVLCVMVLCCVLYGFDRETYGFIFFIFFAAYWNYFVLYPVKPHA